jgi:hypothetical protein
MLQHGVNGFVRFPPCLRQKKSKPSWELDAEQAAFVINSVKEVQATMPVPDEVLYSKWVLKFDTWLESCFYFFGEWCDLSRGMVI